MKISNIVVGQRISPEKVELSKKMRSNMTPAESTLWAAVRKNQLSGFHFRRQQVISGFIVDFYCHDAGLVVELDGGIHAQQLEYDSARDLKLKGLGLTVIRFANKSVLEDIETVIKEIKTHLHSSLAGNG